VGGTSGKFLANVALPKVGLFILGPIVISVPFRGGGSSFQCPSLSSNKKQKDCFRKTSEEMSKKSGEVLAGLAGGVSGHLLRSSKNSEKTGRVSLLGGWVMSGSSRGRSSPWGALVWYMGHMLRDSVVVQPSQVLGGG